MQKNAFGSLNFDYQGYELKFIQKKPCLDGSAHLYTLIYKFYSPITTHIYIVEADYHRGDVFALKFYSKRHRHSSYKFSKITNQGDLGNILITCLKLIPLLLYQFPGVSFCFGASRTIDTKSRRVEPYAENQRFRIYRYIVTKKVGFQTFEHIEYPEISSYLLVNKKSGDTALKERELKLILSSTYNELINI